MIKFYHFIIQISSFYQWYLFSRSLKKIPQVQEKIKKKLRKKFQHSPWQFQKKLTTYLDYYQLIEQERTQQSRPLLKTKHYQPTSGSTSERKWIPYRYDFLQELLRAIAPWLYSLYREYPQISEGRHYWSLSWLPQELREQKYLVDDHSVFGRLEALVMKKIMATPDEVSQCTTSEASQFATCCYLVSCHDLTFIFIWSPSFFLSLLERISLWRFEIANCLEKGEWRQRAQEMPLNLKCPTNKPAAHLLRDWNGEWDGKWRERLWPKLFLISAWKTGQSKICADLLQQKLSPPYFQGKGLFATEGVVTIPWGQEYILSFRSHYYEFLTEKGELLDFSHLKEGMVVSVLITNSIGFYRYHLEDQLLVEKSKIATWKFTFLGRLSHVDLVGEKLSYTSLRKILEQLRKEFAEDLESLKMVFFAIKGNPSCYHLVLESKFLKQQILIEKRVNDLLELHFHFKLARETNQIAPARIIMTESLLKIMNQVCQEKNMIAGDLKMDVVIILHQEQFQRLKF